METIMMPAYAKMYFYCTIPGLLYPWSGHINYGFSSGVVKTKMDVEG